MRDRHAVRPEGPVRIDTGRFVIEGRSRAGNETWFRIRELGVALDIGSCPDPLVGLSHIFVSHAHLDHSLGIPRYFSQRNLLSLPPGRIYVPAETASDFASLMELHQRLEGFRYAGAVRGLAPGDRVELRKNLAVLVHRATHSVPSNSYEFLEVRHKLLPELRGMGREELIARRERGEPLEQKVDRSLLFYTGDTDREIFESSESLFRSDVLMIECSFTAEEDQERGTRYRHIHLHDIWDHASMFENRLLVFMHFSLRDAPHEIHSRISASCPAFLRARVRLALPEPFVRIDNG